MQINVTRRAGRRHRERLPSREPLLHTSLAATHRDHHVRHKGVAGERPNEQTVREGQLNAEDADRRLADIEG